MSAVDRPGELQAAWLVLRRAAATTRRRWPQALAIAGLAAAAVLLRLALRPDRYEARGLLQVGLNVDLDAGEDQRAAGAATRAFFSQVELLTSERVLAGAVARVEGAEVAPGRDRDEALERFLDHVVVRPVRNTFLVEVSGWDPSPERAAARVNALFEVYVRSSNEFLGERYRLQHELGRRREETAHAALRAAEARREEFLARHGEVSFGARGEALAVRSGELEARAARVDVERASIAAEASAVAANLGPGGPDAPEVMLGRLGLLAQAKDLLAPLLEARGALARARAALEPAHPEVHLLEELARAQLEAAQGGLRGLTQGRLEELRRRGAVLEGERVEVERLLAALERERFLLGELQADHGRLVREVALHERELEAVRASQWRVEGRAQVQLAAAVLAPAEVPREPASPFTPLALVGIALGALALGVGAVLAWDHVDDTLRPDDDLAAAAALPVLARIPPLAPRQDERALLRAASDDASASAVGEAFRLLRTNALHALGGPERATLVVTSAVPGEGKTLCAAHLAAALARTGGPVLLVEGDLRRPRLGPLVGVDGRPDGLAQLLLGQRELDEVVRPTALERVSLLPAGPPTSINPSDLLSGGALGRALDAARARFATVVIDGPPALDLADASQLAVRADGVLLVARVGVVRRREVGASLAQLRGVGARLVGLVLNGHLERAPYRTYGAGPALEAGEPPA